MALREALRAENCLVQVEGKTNEDVIKILAAHLLKAGVVKDGYIESVLRREQLYPTGLPLPGHKAAIPHTDSGFVKDTRICIAVLKEPVKFYVMGGAEDETVLVDIIFMLAIKDKNAQIDVLKELIRLVQNDSILDELLKAKDSEEVFQKMLTVLS